MDAVKQLTAEEKRQKAEKRLRDQIQLQKEAMEPKRKKNIQRSEDHEEEAWQKAVNVVFSEPNPHDAPPTSLQRGKPSASSTHEKFTAQSVPSTSSSSSRRSEPMFGGLERVNSSVCELIDLMIQEKREKILLRAEKYQRKHQKKK